MREVYSGPVTSCHTIHTKVIDFEKELTNKEHWFYDLDALSINDYIKCADRGRLSVEEMAKNMLPERDRLRRIADLHQKPTFFGETGYASTVEGAKHPSAWKPEMPLDEQEQANYPEAVMLTFADEPRWKDLYRWK